MSETNQHLIRQYAGNLRQIQTLYETCPIYANPKSLQKEEETVVTSSIFNRENAEVVLKACERYWHFSYLQRHQANEFLIKEEPRSFIVRRSSKNNSYALSIRLPPSCAEPVTHYLILKEPQGYVVQGSKLPFPTLYDLLAHFCFKQSGGMPCLLNPPSVPIPKSSLEPMRAGYALLEKDDNSVRPKRRFDAETMSRLMQSDYETPPPAPPPRRAQDYRTACTVRDDISIMHVNQVENDPQNLTAGSNTLDPRYSNMFDRLAEKMSNILNGDSPHEMDDIEDFEVEVSASDDSGDELPEVSRDDKVHRQSGHAHSRNVMASENTPKLASAVGELPVSNLLTRRAPLNEAGTEAMTPPIPPRQSVSPRKPPNASPSPPPLPPRLPRDRTTGCGSLEPQRSNSPSTSPSNYRHMAVSPGPPRPPKPFHLHKAEKDERNSRDVNGRDFDQSITESTIENFRLKDNGSSELTKSVPVSPSPMDTGHFTEERKTTLSPQNNALNLRHPEHNVEHLESPSGEHGPGENLTRGGKSRGSAKLKKKKKKLKLLFHVKTPSERISEFIKGPASMDDKGPFQQELTSFRNRAKGERNNYQKLLQETRQCMDQLRRILLKEYAADIEKRGRKRCKAFDEVVERSLQDVVIVPLHEHIISVMEDHFQNSKDLHVVRSNIEHGRFMKQSEVGIRDNLVVPDGQAMAAIAETLEAMQKTVSAMRKMELLLEAVKLTYDNIRDAKDPNKSMRSLGADDFLPIFVWVLIQCQCYRAELEAEYMWGLVHPSLLNGEGGYYLTTLTSAVHVIKQLKFDNRPGTPINDTMSTMSDCMAFLEVYIEDPVSGSLMEPTLIPVHPTLDTQNTCQLIVSKCQEIHLDPAKYGLFVVENHNKTELQSSSCPQAIKSCWSNREDTHRYFAYLKKSS